LIKQLFLQKKIWLLSPACGIFAYVILYFIATLYYPGGAQFNKNSKGFSWTQNYWCNLLNENGINGQHNSARPIAMIAMLILCVTLIIFWYIFPRQIAFKKITKWIIQISGFIAMSVGMFLFTNLHNGIINIATGFGIIALTGTFIGLRKIRWMKLFWMGTFIIILITLNNFLYYGNGMLYYLPLVQKITFAYFLLWVFLIDINLYNNSHKQSSYSNGRNLLP
jgi:hypothetical protein